MKKQILLLALGMFTVASFAQKNELKAAEKAIKKLDFSAAVAAINSAEGLIANADAKTKSKFYFLKGQAFGGKKEYEKAGKAYKDLFDFEKSSGKKRYTDKALPMFSLLKDEVNNKAFQLNDVENFKESSKAFYLRYTLDKKDTLYLSNAAQLASRAKDIDVSLKYYRELVRLGYQGIETDYFATNISTGKEEPFSSKSLRDFSIKGKTHNNPIDKKTTSKRAGIFNSISTILAGQNKFDEAVVAIKKAREIDSNKLDYLMNEAQLYIKMNKMDLFGGMMEEAILKDPTNPILYFNLGVVNYNENKLEEAKKYYLKAIELKPDYDDAILNLAIAILTKEKAIIEEMNNNLSNNKKYDALEKQQKEVYKEALPYLEKADSLKRTKETVQRLLNIYEVLEMEEKAKVFRVLYRELR